MADFHSALLRKVPRETDSSESQHRGTHGKSTTIRMSVCCMQCVAVEIEEERGDQRQI